LERDTTILILSDKISTVVFKQARLSEFLNFSDDLSQSDRLPARCRGRGTHLSDLDIPRILKFGAEALSRSSDPRQMDFGRRFFYLLCNEL
jgi:hypothetical protein